MKRLLLSVVLTIGCLTLNADNYMSTCGILFSAPGQDYYDSYEEYIEAMEEFNYILCGEYGRPFKLIFAPIDPEPIVK